MSAETREPTLTDRIDERPGLNLRRIAQARPRDLLIRFFTGGLTSVGAGVVTLVFGARAGGVLLAFPAILAASLTLIAEQEDSADAREDARGAIAGGIAMIVFAVVAMLLLGQGLGGAALLIATVAWLASALVLYFALWWR